MRRGKMRTLGISMKPIAPLVALGCSLIASAVAAQDCGTLPVVTATQAICLAEQSGYAERNPRIELQWEASDAKSHWLVLYRPKSFEVRGGGGDLKVDKKSGKVTFLKGYR